jgi:hypothetical protein
MARSQVVPKKGRNSSSAKRPGRSPQAARRARSRRPRATTRAGGKGQGRSRGAGDRTANGPRRRARADQRSLTSADTGFKPEASQPPTLVAGDATVAEQRRAASRQPRGRRTNRPAGAAPRKPGARGGGTVDRATERERTKGRRRRRRGGDALESGRKDLADPTRESTRGAIPRGGKAGRRARARRATPRGGSRSAGTDRRRSANLRQTPSPRNA